MTPTIAILGATGQTGRSIVDGLLDPNATLSSPGLTIRPFSITSPHETLVSSLTGVDILISCISGAGEQMFALTDLRDVGRYVARIDQDERTVNKYLLCYNETHSSLDNYELTEKLSGETIPRNFVSRKELEADIAEALPLLQSSGTDLRSGEGAAIAFKAVGRRYAVSLGVRGDNTPEKAKELGYVTSKELWPEMEFVKYEDFLRDVVEGRAKPVYEDQWEGYQQAWQNMKEQKKLQSR